MVYNSPIGALETPVNIKQRYGESPIQPAILNGQKVAYAALVHRFISTKPLWETLAAFSLPSTQVRRYIG